MKELGVKTKQQIASELSMSMSTFRRRLAEHKLVIPRGLICANIQKKIYYKLGFSDLWEGKNREIQGEKTGLSSMLTQSGLK